MTAFEHTSAFLKTMRKLDKTQQDKAETQIKKIIQNPNIGKPMRYDRKGTRELYVKPFRVSYEYFEKADKLLFLALYHKDKQ